MACSECGQRGEVICGERTIRGKWIYSGSGSIEEMAVTLEQQAEFLRELRDEGYELVEGGDDYWTLRVDPDDLPEDLSSVDCEQPT
jgi:hypothetical protein